MTLDGSQKISSTRRSLTGPDREEALIEHLLIQRHKLILDREHSTGLWLKSAHKDLGRRWRRLDVEDVGHLASFEDHHDPLDRPPDFHSECSLPCHKFLETAYHLDVSVIDDARLQIACRELEE